MFLFEGLRDSALYLMTTLLPLRSNKVLSRQHFQPALDDQLHMIQLKLIGTDLVWSGSAPSAPRAEAVLIDKLILWANKNFTILGKQGLFQLMISADDMPKGRSEARRRTALLSGKAFLRDLVGPKHARLAKHWCPETDIDTALEVCVVLFQLLPLQPLVEAPV